MTYNEFSHRTPDEHSSLKCLESIPFSLKSQFLTYENRNFQLTAPARPHKVVFVEAERKLFTVL